MGKKKLGDLWPHYPGLQKILRDSSASEKRMQLTTIANQTSRDPGLVKKCLNHAYINRLTYLHCKSKAKKWLTSWDFQEAKKLLHYGCPQLDEGISYEAMGLKWYCGLLMSHTHYPGIDDCNNANRLRTISPLEPPANHEIPIPPPSTDKSKMLTTPTSPSKGEKKEKNESNIRGHWMDVASDRA